MKVLITGGNGYLGSSLTEVLLKKGYQISLLLRPGCNCKHLKKLTSRIKKVYFKSDKDIKNFIMKIRPDIVIHTACAYGKNNETLSDMIDANLRFGLSVVNSLLSLNKSIKFVNAGTKLNFGQTLYSISKRHFAEYCNFVAKNNKNFKFINLLIHNFYGQKDNPKKFPMELIYACYKNKKYFNLTRGDQKRDFIYIEDLINAFLKIIKNINLFDQITDIEVGSGKTTTVRKFAEIIRELTKSKTKLLFNKLPKNKNEIMRVNSNIKKIKSLKWKPKFSLREGILMTIKKEFN